MRYDGRVDRFGVKHETRGPKPLPVAQRPRCIACGKVCGPEWRFNNHYEKGGQQVLYRELRGYGFRGDGLFHSERCAALWGSKRALIEFGRRPQPDLKPLPRGEG